MVTATDDRSDRLASLESDVRNINNRLDTIQDDIREMRADQQAGMREIQSEMRQMRAEHQAEMREVNERIDQVNERIDQVNRRFDQVHRSFDVVHGRIDRLFWAIIGVGGGVIAALIVLILRIGSPAG